MVFFAHLFLYLFIFNLFLSYFYLIISSGAFLRSSARQSNGEAVALLKWALRVRLKCLGPRHLHTADTLRKVGGLQHQEGILDDAEGCYA